MTSDRWKPVKIEETVAKILIIEKKATDMNKKWRKNIWTENSNDSKSIANTTWKKNSQNIWTCAIPSEWDWADYLNTFNKEHFQKCVNPLNNVN